MQPTVSSTCMKMSVHIDASLRRRCAVVQGPPHMARQDCSLEPTHCVHPSLVPLGESRCSCLWAALLLLGAPMATGTTGTAPGPQLRFRADGTFKIAQFTDLHYGQGSDIDAQSNQASAHSRSARVTFACCAQGRNLLLRKKLVHVLSSSSPAVLRLPPLECTPHDPKLYIARGTPWTQSTDPHIIIMLVH